MTAERRTLVQSVGRASRVLYALKAGAPKTPRQISEEIGIERTVTYRLLRTLQSDGLVAGVGRSWRLDAGILDLATSYLETHPFAMTAPAFAMDLHKRAVSGHPWLVSLGLPVTDHVVLFERFWTENSPLNATTAIGARLPMDTSATGLAMLSRMNAEEGVRRVGPERYERAGAALAEVRENGGLAMAHDILRPGVSALAASVTDRTETVVGAVNVSGLELDEHLHVDSDLARHVARTAASITTALQ